MISKETFKKVMRRHAASVVVISVSTEDGMHGMTATSFTSVSAEPPLVLFCIHRANQTHGLLAVGDRVGISVLAEHQEEWSNHFAVKVGPPPAQEPGRTPCGIPLVPDACAGMEVELRERYDGGDHSIFVGTVSWADVADHRAPLVYHDGRYARVGTLAAAHAAQAGASARRE